jgi:hypothetical protein
VPGKHTAVGFVINSTGTPGFEIVTGADSAEAHPDEFVTLKVKTPSSRFVMILTVPLPVIVNDPGNLVIIQESVEGKPLNTTLPVGSASVGWVIVPTTGAAGVGGCAGITTFAEGTDRHPFAVITVKLYVPEVSPVIVELVPVPDVETVPGYRINVQVPVAGKPDKTTLPVDNVQPGGVIVPTEGAGGVGGCALIRTFPDCGDIHPVELVTVKEYVPAGMVVIVIVVPEPDTVTAPGFLVKVHEPVGGNPLKTTLPVDIAQVGWVIIPITGGAGAAGGAAITASADEVDEQPSALVTRNLYVPAVRPETVVFAPVPFVVIAPGLRINVHVPAEGNPLRTTLPVETAQVRFVIVPIAGADGNAFTVKV